MISAKTLLLLSFSSLVWSAQKRVRTTMPMLQLFNPLDTNLHSQGNLEIQKVECSSNPLIIEMTCDHRPIANTNGDITIVADYKRSLASSFTEIKLYKKSVGDKVYKPTALRQKMNYCMMTQNPNMPNILMMFIPKSIEQILPICPLFGKYVFNFTIPSIPVDLAIFSQGDYRLNCIFTTDDQVVTTRVTVFLKVEPV